MELNLKKYLKGWYASKVKKPMAATIDDWQDWTETAKSKHPLLYWLFEDVPTFFSKCKRMVFDFKYHSIQKYTNKGYHHLILDVKRFKEPYGKNHMGKYGWMDADTQLELFSFQILINFVENEYGYECLRESINESDNAWALKEALDLYEWFINDYCDSSYETQLKKELNKKYPNSKELRKNILFEKPKNDLEKAYRKDYSIMLDLINQNEEHLRNEMTENLIRLVKIRGVLWT